MPDEGNNKSVEQNEDEASMYEMSLTQETEASVEVEVQSSNVTNPFLHLPHNRFQCAKYPYDQMIFNGGGGGENEGQMAKKKARLNHHHSNIDFCELCYCYICDVLASECKNWSEHCDANDTEEGRWKEMRQMKKNSGQSNNTNGKTQPNNAGNNENVDVIDLCDDDGVDNGNSFQPSSATTNPLNRSSMMNTSPAFQEIYVTPEMMMDDGDDSDLDEIQRDPEETDDDDKIPPRFTNDPRKRILDVFLQNVKIEDKMQRLSLRSKHHIKVKSECDNTEDSKPKITGMSDEWDVQSNCKSSFYMKGLNIGWPYQKLFPPQRLIALHLTTALQNSRHCILESPTGTGKSAILLCTALAWQRSHNAKVERRNERVKIIYCSRTHSQIEQLSASLESLPYRPRMVVLGSRKQTCVNEEVKKTSNLNFNCQIRRANTDRVRKQVYKQKKGRYDDSRPPLFVNSDEATVNVNNDTTFPSNKLTCGAYRQLSREVLAKDVITKYASETPNPHDIEDLKRFSMIGQSTNEREYSIKKVNNSFGLRLVEEPIDSGIIIIELSRFVTDIKPKSRLISVNGRAISDFTSYEGVINYIKSLDDTTYITVANYERNQSDYPTCCPYYLTQSLLQLNSTELIFAPYNYVIDPGIRQAISLPLGGNTVVIIDEAHNVEDTLREAGSCSVTEFELCEAIIVLDQFATKRRSIDASPDDMDIGEISHTLLLFIEKLVEFVMRTKRDFEETKNFITKKSKSDDALVDVRRYGASKEFQAKFIGPPSSDINTNPIGCKRFFDDEIKVSHTDMNQVRASIQAFEDKVRNESSSDEHSDNRAKEQMIKAVDSIVSLVSNVVSAFQAPEHYYVATVIRHNGDLPDDEGRVRGRQARRRPFIHPRTEARPKAELSSCMHPRCRSSSNDTLINSVRHGKYCDGDDPKWEAKFVLHLLTPGILMEQLTSACRSVVLASGTLSPIKSLAAELNLFPEKEFAEASTVASSPANTIQVVPQRYGRLQIKPSPLEANHVINLNEQLMAMSIGHFDDGTPLKVTLTNYSRDDFILKLGEAICSVVESVPKGGIIIFLPSYSLLKRCTNLWDPTSSYKRNFYYSESIDGYIWERMCRSKNRVILEPSQGSEKTFEQSRDDYLKIVREHGSCILLAVYRGKMSEGISFNDDNARCVICVGVPYPNYFDMSIVAKKKYNDEQRSLRQRTDLLPGDEWFSQQAYRALSQALGRCIRHAFDYGAIILMDQRHCDSSPDWMDGAQSNEHKNLPKWIRHHVKSLSKDNSGKNQASTKEIGGGWRNLKTTMKSFFDNAQKFTNCKMEESKQQNTKK